VKPMIGLMLICLPIAAESPGDSRLVNHSYGRAAKIILAADSGDAKARFLVALMHEKGDVVPQNHKEALKWYKLSAEEGYAPAQLFLGLMYASGEGVAQDSAEAIKWVRKAADQGNTDAQFYLAGVFFIDRIVPHNYVESYKWFLLAAPKDDAKAAKAREGVLALMTPAEVDRAERLVVEWRLKNVKK
jgi:TPR repeat protein